MKKIILLCAVVMIALVTGCSKDDKDNENLVGSTWKSNETSTVGSTTYEWSGSIAFTSDKNFAATMTTKKNGTQTDSRTFTGTYSYNPPKIVMTINGVSESGTINGKKLTIAVDPGEEPTVFTKQ